MRDLIDAAKKLVDSAEFDVNGHDGRGGHGGLTSNETLKAAGILRQEIYRAEKQTDEDPSSENS